MAERLDTIDMIERSKTIVILRHVCDLFIDKYLPTLLEAGMTAVEVSLTASSYLGCFDKLVKGYRDQVVIGTGTVSSIEDARQAIDKGSSFLISPHFDERLCEFVRNAGILYIPGCLTPTEIARAIHIGVDTIKIFPAFLGGPRYISALRAPFPNARFVPAGGIAAVDAERYWEAGAWAVSIGSELNTLMQETDAFPILKMSCFLGLVRVSESARS